MKKIFERILTVVMVLIIAFAFLFVGVRIFGLTPYTVLSGSMEPTYHVGSLIYVKDVDPEDLEVGDPITYTISKNTVVTHRIVEIIYDENDPSKISFKTKGDNNEDPDGEPVPAENILGKPVFSIPLLGYVIFYIQRPPWNAIAIGLLIILLGLAFLPDLIDKICGTDDKDSKDNDSESGEKKSEGEPKEDSPPELPDRGNESKESDSEERSASAEDSTPPPPTPPLPENEDSK